MLPLALLLLVIGLTSGTALPSAPSGLPSHHHATDPWVGSPDGKAYSEFNHHLAGWGVSLMGLSELMGARMSQSLAGVRFVVPASLSAIGLYLLIWSDHDAWPIGEHSFAAMLSGVDMEALQHKTYALLLLTVASIEFVRVASPRRQVGWSLPLPALAIAGGLLLFLHSHGPHPATQAIAFHHAVMGALAVTAGSCKLMANYRSPGARSKPRVGRSSTSWELAWASAVLLIGLQLLLYGE